MCTLFLSSMTHACKHLLLVDLKKTERYIRGSLVLQLVLDYFNNCHPNMPKIHGNHGKQCLLNIHARINKKFYSRVPSWGSNPRIYTLKNHTYCALAVSATLPDILTMLRSLILKWRVNFDARHLWHYASKFRASSRPHIESYGSKLSWLSYKFGFFM